MSAGARATRAPLAASGDRRKPRNFIDEQIDRQLARLNLPASPACERRRVRPPRLRRHDRPDARRPTRCGSSWPIRRPASATRLIDALIARPEFADYWTYKWSDVLMLNGTRLRPDVAEGVLQLGPRARRGRHAVGQFVREIITATGESLENGATNFYALSQSPEDMTENACQAFLGLSIGCAKCHNHPLEKWTNDQYYAMANMFARVKAKGWGGEARNGDGQRTLYVSRFGRPDPAADGQAAAADAARRPAARARRSGRPPREPGPAG